MKKKLNPIIYKRININNLIIYCVYLISLSKEKCTFERLAKECFDLFPDVFAFSRYPNWPDARKLDRPIRSLRSKKLISGSGDKNYFLTKQGKKRAEEISKKFRQKGLFE